MKFSPDFIQRVQEANNLVDLISQHTVLKPAGGGLMGRCPFPDHNEKTPSFSVSEQKQVYNCFGCHKKGNIFTFLEQFNGMSFRESVEYLAARASIALPQVNEAQSAEYDRESQRKREILRTNRLAMEFFVATYQALPAQHVAKLYVAKRGLNEDTIEKFKVGYAPAEWDSLIQFLQKKGISRALMLDAKLVKQRTQGTGEFDLFRHRIMFPILDTKNEVIAFGGRALGADDVKYLNSPETPVFSKSRTLYGLAETAKYIRAEDFSLIVEGYMDLVSLYQAGLCTGAAPMGTALTFEQSRSLRRLSQNVIVLFDGDEAGQNAAEKSLPILLEADLHARGVILPDGLDPDDYLKQQGPEALVKLLNEAADLFSLILEKWTLGIPVDQSSHKVQIIDRLKPLFAKMSDARLRDLYLLEAALKLKVEKSWLIEALRESKTSNSTPNPGVPTHQAFTPPPPAAKILSGALPSAEIQEPVEVKWSFKGASKAEVMILQLVLRNQNLMQKAEEDQVAAQILHGDCQKIFLKALQVYRQNPIHFDRLGSLLANDVQEVGTLLGDPMMHTSSESSPKKMEEEAQTKTSGAEDFTQEQTESYQTEIRLYEDLVMKLRERSFRQQAHVLKTEINLSLKSGLNIGTRSNDNRDENPGGALTAQIDPAKLEQFVNLHKQRLAVRNKRLESPPSTVETLNDKVDESDSVIKREDDSEFK